GNGHGRALVKQVRHHVMANGRARLRQIVEGAVGVKLVSVHHYISTVTGEELLAFTLAEVPSCRVKKRE
ncbi:MAG: Na-translocating system protein MpsC family protein, partial [Planctomycetaceae bacterium]